MDFLNVDSRFRILGELKANEIHGIDGFHWIFIPPVVLPCCIRYYSMVPSRHVTSVLCTTLYERNSSTSTTPVLYDRVRTGTTGTTVLTVVRDVQRLNEE